MSNDAWLAMGIYRTRPEHQREPVDAVAQPRRLGAVVEHVAEVAAAPPAKDRLADHAERGVALGQHGAVQGIPETRPAGAALELRRGGEEIEPAAGARERAFAFLLQEGTAERRLGGVMTQDLVLIRRENLLPLRISTDRKSTRLNSSHLGISYAVFCLKKKKH